MPGNTLPSKSSSEAPPPVEQWVTLSVSAPLGGRRRRVAAADHRDGTPLRGRDDGIHDAACAGGELGKLEDAERAVPDDGLGARDDLGEFLDRLRAAIKPLPARRNALCRRDDLRVSALGSNLSAATKSTGKWIGTPLAFALAITSGTTLAPAASKSEVPISMLLSTLRKVYAMPPPMMISSALSIRLLMS